MTFFFGIYFVYKSKVRDLEHQHITTPLGGRTRIKVETESGPAQATTEINVHNQSCGTSCSTHQ